MTKQQLTNLYIYRMKLRKLETVIRLDLVVGDQMLNSAEPDEVNIED